MKLHDHESNIKAHFKGEPVILKFTINGWYNALQLSTQEEIWIKADGKELVFDVSIHKPQRKERQWTLRRSRK